MTEARFGDLALGDLHARLSPLPLLVGRATIVFAGPESVSTKPLRGSASVSRHGFGVDHMTATVATGRLFAPVPVSALDLDDVSVRFRDGQCEAAEGRVRATLAGDVGGITLPQSVSGTARCDGTALLLPLASQSGTESIALRIEGGGDLPRRAVAASVRSAGGPEARTGGLRERPERVQARHRRTFLTSFWQVDG
ncbi:type II secretion system protein N [Sphingomonas sp. H160509]|uniref:type II secretion system protein N n=1 Tax=Sphingomonas sp. H160509 TaxID=2955313 RepID=UPI003158C1BB